MTRANSPGDTLPVIFDNDAVREWLARWTVPVIGLYATGSLATGAFDPRVSDVDLIAVVDETPAVDIIEILPEMGRPPGRGVDLEIYSTNGVRSLDRINEHRRWIRWNIGEMPQQRPIADRPEYDWAPDLEIARTQGIGIRGPAPDRLIAPVPRDILVRACVNSVSKWAAREHFGAPASGILNACRAWMYCADNRLGSKLDGGEWAISRVDEPGIIRAALRSQATASAEQFDDAEVAQFIRAIYNNLPN